MSDNIKNKSVGFYFILISAICGVISLIRFIIWAPTHQSMDMLIVCSLIAGIIIDTVLFFKDNDYFVILSTVMYGIALFKLLANSVGSFADAFQGINVFGDATQVGTIISISGIILVSACASIVAGFLKRTK